MAATAVGGSGGQWIRMCVLLLLAEQPAHGYELLQNLAILGADDVDTGTLYRVLRRTERDQLTCSTWHDAESGPPRRVYELTPGGSEALETAIEELEHSRKLIEAFLGRSRSSRTALT